MALSLGHFGLWAAVDGRKESGKKDAKIGTLCVPGTWTFFLFLSLLEGGIILILQMKKLRLRVKC